MYIFIPLRLGKLFTPPSDGGESGEDRGVALFSVLSLCIYIHIYIYTCIHLIHSFICLVVYHHHHHHHHYHYHHTHTHTHIHSFIHSFFLLPCRLSLSHSLPSLDSSSPRVIHAYASASRKVARRASIGQPSADTPVGSFVCI